MHKIFIDGNIVKRNVYIDFDINSSISYDSFCENDDVFGEIKKIAGKYLQEDIYAINFLRFILLSGHINENVVKKAQILFLYDIHEEYNIEKYKYKDNILRPAKTIEREWFSYKNMDTLSLNEDIDLVKSFITDNHMIHNDSWSQMGLPFENPLLRINYDEFVDMVLNSEDNNDKSSDTIEYGESLFVNKRFHYIFLMSLLLEEPLYLITDDRLFDFTIVSQSNIGKHLITNGLIWNLKQGLGVRYNNLITDIDEKLSNIRKEYMKHDSEGGLKKVIDDITKLVSKVGTTEINIQFQDHNPMHMTGKFKTNDMEKYEELKEYTADYGHITHQNHGGKKCIIIGEKQFKYKPNKDGKGKDNL